MLEKLFPYRFELFFISLTTILFGGVFFPAQIFHTIIDPVFFIVNILSGIVMLSKTKKLKIGEDIGIISYNESPINEIILDGLTTLSTDFKEMGRLAAEMVKSGRLLKIVNKFDLVIRKTM